MSITAQAILNHSTCIKQTHVNSSLSQHQETQRKKLAKLGKALANDGFEAYYRQTISQLEKTGFADVVHHKVFCDQTNRAKAPLSSYELAMQYTALYGTAHFARFRHLLQSVLQCGKSSCDKPLHLNVVDYGCGQGIATLALLDYIKQYANHPHICLTLHLVEPSHVSLHIAHSLVQQLAASMQVQVEINVHQQTLEDYLACNTADNTANNKNNHDNEMAYDHTLHLFSNVLDVEQVQAHLPALASHLQDLTGKQLVLAVSPVYSNATDGMARLASLLDNAQTDISVKQPISQFGVICPMFHVRRLSWQTQYAKGIMMALAFSQI